MDREDRDRLIRIETILEESVVPRLVNHGPRIARLEKVALAATIAWGGVCVLAYVAKDTASEWLKNKVLGHNG
jgi:Fe-S cluster biogenesis protein NfuA